MSQAATTPQSAVPADLSDLLAAVASLPPSHARLIAPLAERVVAGAQRRRKILDLVQDALSQLRLDMKYLIFDLESTRRERDAFKRELEELRGE